jgi:hypothetical protein
MEVHSLERSKHWWDRRGRWRSQWIILECGADSCVHSISYHSRDTTKENRKELSAIQNGEIQQWLAADACLNRAAPLKPSVRAHRVLESRRISARLVLVVRRAAELVMGMELGSAPEDWSRFRRASRCWEAKAG